MRLCFLGYCLISMNIRNKAVIYFCYIILIEQYPIMFRELKIICLLVNSIQRHSTISGLYLQLQIPYKITLV